MIRGTLGCLLPALPRPGLSSRGKRLFSYSSGHTPSQTFASQGAIMGAVCLIVLLAVGLPFAVILK